MAIVLHLVGAKPVTEGTGRIARFELQPLSDLGGRPRVDVLCNMSGIFRDSFQVPFAKYAPIMQSKKDCSLTS